MHAFASAEALTRPRPALVLEEHIVEVISDKWRNHMRGNNSSSFGPLVAPTVSSMPSRASDRIDSLNVAGPTVSTTARAPLPPVTCCTLLENPSLGNAASAPRSSAR